MDQRRVERELNAARNDSNSGISIESVGDSLTRLRGVIFGPPGTPYEGGKFTIDIELPSNYPFTPPKMKFATKIYHPNISSQTGGLFYIFYFYSYLLILFLIPFCLFVDF